MPAYRIQFTHSAMPKDYVGSALKFAHTPEEAAKFLGKYSKRDATILDKRNCLLSNVKIYEER